MPLGSEIGGPSSGQAIRVLCVEDHDLVVEGLRVLFETDGGLQVVGSLSNAAGLVAEVQRLRPHIVLLDIELPGPDAFEMADRLRRAYPDVRIIVLSAYARESFVTAAFDAGACAYFTKSDDVAELVSGIRQVVRSPGGAFVLGPTLRQHFRVPASASSRRQRAGQSAPPHSGSASDPVVTLMGSLTARELEILRLIGKGLGRTQIAAQLSRSVKTIDGHQGRMMRKLKITARADLIRLAIREGIAQA